MENFGVSLSIKQCRSFDISSVECLSWLIKECGFRRFRLMSYWDEIESEPGVYDFRELDKQIKLIAKHKGTISLCLGARQPRWPENHWPEWAWKLSKPDRSKALLAFLSVVVKRYKNNKNIVSYQLENEALLHSFGRRPEVDRRRLRLEYQLVKRLDPSTPICMSTSTSWGIPLRQPVGDLVGFSFYQIIYSSSKRKYTTAFHKTWLHKWKALLIKLIWRRGSFIHELQLEPWGPNSIWNMPHDEQMKSMSPDQAATNIRYAVKTGLKPIDLWGGEWWYWLYKKYGDKTIPNIVLEASTLI